MVVMGYNKYWPESLDVLIHVEPTVGLWEGKTQSLREKKPHLGGHWCVALMLVYTGQDLALGSGWESGFIPRVLHCQYAVLVFFTPLKEVKLQAQHAIGKLCPDWASEVCFWVESQVLQKKVVNLNINLQLFGWSVLPRKKTISVPQENLLPSVRGIFANLTSL